MIFEFLLHRLLIASEMDQHPPNLKAMQPISSPNSNTSKPPKAKTISISILVFSLPVLYASLLHVPPSNLIKDTTFWFLLSNSIILIVATDSGVFSSSSDKSDDIHDEFIRHNRNRTSRLATAPVEEGVMSGLVNSKKICSITIEQDVTQQMHTTRQTIPEEAYREKEEMPDEQKSRGCQRELPLALPPSEESKEGTKEERCDRIRSEIIVDGEETVQSEKVLLWSATDPPADSVSSGSSTSTSDEEGSEYSNMSDEELNRRVEEFIRKFNREIMLQELRN